MTTDHPGLETYSRPEMVIIAAVPLVLVADPVFQTLWLISTIATLWLCRNDG